MMEHLKDELWDMERKAGGLRWANVRRWTFATHVWEEPQMLVVDLHDLNVKLAKEVVRKTCTLAGKMDYASICFVTGQGKHSGDKPQIRPMAIKVAGEFSKKKGWRITSGTQGRVSIILDEDRAPAVVTSKLSRTVVVGMVLFGTLIFGLFIKGLFTV